MKTYKTNQRAYSGQFSVIDPDTNRLIHGGGVTVQRPRLYATAEAAQAAASAMSAMRPEVYGAKSIEAVELI